MKHTATIQYTLNAPTNKVWKWLTEPELVKQYFFGTNLVTTWEVNTPIFWRGEWDGNAYEDKGIVLQFNPQKLFAYTYLSSWSNLEDKPENYQTITFQLVEIDGNTNVIITQTNIPTEEQKQHSEQNWISILAELQKQILAT
jgi:uncharacterized protein YndB with AHSA1/START domain